MFSQAKILTLVEIKTIADYLRERAKRLDQALLHLAIFRLSACCGLRCKEMAGLDILDLKQNGEWPYIVLRKEVVKGEQGKRKARSIPLWWDNQTYLDLVEWQAFRLASTHGENGPFLCGLRADYCGQRLRRPSIAQHWNRILAAVLGPVRAKSLSIHKGRHSYASHCIAAGVSLPELRDALGHSSLSITSIYAHAVDSGVRNIFGS
jgi:integrase/recombinase XerD